MLQPLPVAEWKWEYVTMDFVMGLPKSPRGHDAIEIRGSPLDFGKVYKLHLVSLRRDLKRFDRGGKLSPCYIGPFDIIAKIGEVAYHLALSPQLLGVHDVFHVSMLQKYEPNPSHVLEWKDLELEADVSYVERSIRFLDTLEHVLRGRTIPMVKVLWIHHRSDEATWEKEDAVRAKYLELFRS
ncbi:uncharacterized protein LOC130790435 [Actinidia eriantha]|uniref:uncharacterized protein LOC130790435 n=1 Tax=Actinidia eriantha TaxID=165200 RepID=UPI00258DE7B6|nr:uncharacterized protein LOC130790435 [Actinidia eriantha]